MESPRQKILYEFGHACDVGRKRRGEPNQDVVELILSESSNGYLPACLVVADGLGGHLGGSTASRLVARVFREEFQRSPRPANYSQLLELCASQAHLAVRELAARDVNLSTMGSTVVAVVIDQENLYMLNVGDSRAYILRGEHIFQISQDQSWVAAQVRNGLLSSEEAVRHPQRSRLDMAISAKRKEIVPYAAEKKLEPSDIVVLCSDGLWGVLPEALIWATASELPPQEAADKLVTLANNSQGPDNISVIIARPANSDRKAVVPGIEDTDPGV